MAVIPTSLSGAVVKKKNDYSHYVDVACTLTKQPDIKIWNELQEANPHLKKTDIIRVAIYALHSNLTNQKKG
jgi:hypothetical protein